MGKETTQPVAAEINQCIAVERRLLVFKLPCENIDEQTSSLLNKVRDLAKWQDVESISELSNRIRLAFGDEVVRALRDPTPAFRSKRLGEQYSISVASCKMAWQALGVPDALAEEFSREANVGAVLKYPGLGVHTLEGPLGSGKTLASQRMFQLAIIRALEDSSEPFPIFVTARDLHVPLKDYIEQECRGFADPFTQGVFVVVDGVDEKGAREGEELLRQASVYVDANPRATVLITTRSLSGIHTIGNLLTMPALDYDQVVDLIRKVSGQEFRLNNTYRWPSSMRDVARIPLFAVMIGAKLRDNPDLIFSSQTRLIELLAEDALQEASDNSAGLDRLLHTLAAHSIDSGSRVPLDEIDKVRANQRLLTTSRLVTEYSGTVDFTLPIFREWYAARALLEGTVGIEELEQVSDRWLVPLSMTLYSGDDKFIQSLMTHLTSSDPGVASLLIDEHQSEHERLRSGTAATSASFETGEQVGDNILGAMAAWERGLGKLYSVIAPVGPDGATKPLRIGLKGRYIVTRWYNGTQKEPLLASVSFEETHDRSLLDWSMFAMEAPDTELWRWVYTKKYLVHRQEKAIGLARLAICSHDAIRELSWEFALSASGQSSYGQTELDVQGVLKHIASLSLDNDTSIRLKGISYSISEINAVENHLKGLLAKEETVIADPWPQRNMPRISGPLWKFYSDQQLLARTQAVFSAALRIYAEVVGSWYERFAPRLRLFSLMPARLEGRLEIPLRESPPTTEPKMMLSLGYSEPKLSWHPRILPLGEQSEALFEIGTPTDDERDDEQYFSEESGAFARLRGQGSIDSRLFRVSSLFDVHIVLGPRPATTMACKWLVAELRELKWY